VAVAVEGAVAVAAETGTVMAARGRLIRAITAAPDRFLREIGTVMAARGRLIRAIGTVMAVPDRALREIGMVTMVPGRLVRAIEAGV
jgi:uncharacterized protein YjeT (DUF2065 family)